jgi:uncharacterized protein
MAPPPFAPVPGTSVAPIAPAAPLAAATDPSNAISAQALIQSNTVLAQLARGRSREPGPTLDEFMRQALDAKLEEWLRANLPDLVERLVQQEIDRIRRRID